MAEQAALSTANFSTGDVPAARRLERWERHNAEQLVALRCQVPGGADDFGAEETVVSLGGCGSPACAPRAIASSAPPTTSNARRRGQSPSTR